jgi:Tfp pilus assembly protein PilX
MGKIEMKKTKHEDAPRRGADGERGAALVTSLMLSTLLLVAGGALILTTSTGTVTAADSTAEMQAYYAAESGLQSALAVLRGNVPPRAGHNTGGTRMRNNFRAANQLAVSNVAADAANNPDNNAATNDGFARLSGWLPYNGTDAGAAVPVGANNEAGFQITISDPDDLTRAQLNGNAAYMPSRLVITSTGFGPRGARKRMQMMMRRGAFDFDPPSTLTMTGNVTSFLIGNSAAKGYSGVDESGVMPTLPMFGFTDAASHTNVYDSTFSPSCTTTYCNKARNGTSDPESDSLTNSETPEWLRSADAARSFLNDLQAQAAAQGRYFAVKDGASAPGIGSTSNPQFTFVDGDITLNGSGAGLLVVTGDLTFNGNFSFDGIILVMGSWKDSGGALHGGDLVRNGGGNGSIAGALVVSHFDRTTNTGFLPTTFNTNGGGNSDIVYNSTNVANALNSLASRVLGVSEF